MPLQARGLSTSAGSLDVSLLHELLGVPPLVLALGVVAVAGLGFAGAEKLEEVFSARYDVLPHAPPRNPRLKLGLVGAFAVVALLGTGVRPIAPDLAPDLPPVQAASMAPLSLAEAIIGKTPGLLVLDLRDGAAEATKRIPGSYPATTPEAVEGLLATAPVGGTVILVDDVGARKEIPTTWRRNVEYRFLQDGFLGWELKVLTPSLPGDTQEDREWAARQGQISAYFSGAAVQISDVAAPPPMAGAGGAKPKKKGGC